MVNARKVLQVTSVSSVPLGWHVLAKGIGDEILPKHSLLFPLVPAKENPTDNFNRPVSLANRKQMEHTTMTVILYWTLNPTG